MPGNILIVDDEAPVRNMIQRTLQRHGYSCLQAADGREARAFLEKEPVDLILCDINMPGESGLELIAWVKEAHPDVAIIMVSGINDTDVARAALEAGVYGYLVKPFELNQILISTLNALRRRDLEFQERSFRMDLEEQVQIKTSDLNRLVLELKNAVHQFRGLAEGSIQGILIHQDLQPVFVNESFAQIHGYTIAGIMGLPSILSLISSEDQTRLMGYREARLKGKPAPVRYEYRGLRKDGARIWLEGLVSVVQWEGAPAVQLTVADITGRKESDEALRQSHQEMEAIISGISCLLIGFSHDHRITQWNGLCEEVLGIPKEMALGKHIEEVNVGWDSNGIMASISDCQKANKVIRIEEVNFTRPNGREGFLGITLTPIPIHASQKPTVLLMGADLTEKRILEIQLAQAQKLESIGQLAAGIAHEINTPIQYVGNNVRFLQGAFTDLVGAAKLYGQLLADIREKVASHPLMTEIDEHVESVDLPYLEEEIPLAIDQTLDGVERVSRIVLSMKEFSHPGTDTKTPIDINKALENTITVARNEWKYVADLETDLDPELPPVPCIPGEMNQVFLNILLNAAQAIGEKAGGEGDDKGRIRITTRSLDDQVEIRISDTGPGVPRPIQNRLFDPFFTTKEPGKGTGQGLAISHNVVVRKHNGTIQLETEEGKGTTFTIRLPLTMEEPDPVP